LDLALLKAGNNMAARMAMMAMTTSSSMSVNAREASVAAFIQGFRWFEAKLSPRHARRNRSLRKTVAAITTGNRVPYHFSFP